MGSLSALSWRLSAEDDASGARGQQWFLCGQQAVVFSRGRETLPEPLWFVPHQVLSVFSSSAASADVLRLPASSGRPQTHAVPLRSNRCPQGPPTTRAASPRRRVRPGDLGNAGVRRAPPNQPDTEPAQADRWAPPGPPASRLARDGPWGPPKPRGIKWVPVARRGA